MTIGERIRAVRVGQGIDQWQLAERMSIPVGTIMWAENASRPVNMPVGTPLDRYARALGVPVAVLTGAQPLAVGCRVGKRWQR